MPFRIALTKVDVQSAMTDQGYTTARAPNLDRLDANISTRAAPGDILVNTANKIDGSYIDAAISSRAAPGAAMDIIASARAAIWNELIPATPTSGSFGERVKNNLDAAVSSRANGADYTAARAANLDNLDAAISSRAAPGAAMDLVAGARTAIWNEAIPATPASGSYGEKINSNLDAAVSSRARLPGQHQPRHPR
jgi:hypothetical protein